MTLNQNDSPVAILVGTSWSVCVSATDLVTTRIFSSPMIITKYGNISLKEKGKSFPYINITDFNISYRHNYVKN